jgi:multicomponent Na+:H+ antiporter subunit B
MIPIILIVGVNIVLHGQLTPGGGFQGGTIIAAALTLYAISFGISGDKWKIGRMEGAKCLGLTIIGSCALAGIAYRLLTGRGYFMQNSGLFPPGIPGYNLSSGSVLLFSLGESLNVAFGFMLVILVYTLLMESRSG